MRNRIAVSLLAASLIAAAPALAADPSPKASPAATPKVVSSPHPTATPAKHAKVSHPRVASAKTRHAHMAPTGGTTTAPATKSSTTAPATK